MPVDWEERAARATTRYEDGVARLPDEPDERQRQLTRMGNAAWAAGLCHLMAGRPADAETWLGRAADRYRESWADAPVGSWGRPIGAMKCHVLRGDAEGARSAAEWALDAGAAGSESPIGRYAAVLAHLLRGEDGEALTLASSLHGADGFPAAVTAVLDALAGHDSPGYETAIAALLADFEGRDAFLEDVPVADTVLVLQALAAARGLAAELESSLLPG
jgi:hypothetical protein